MIPSTAAKYVSGEQGELNAQPALAHDVRVSHLRAETRCITGGLCSGITFVGLRGFRARRSHVLSFSPIDCPSVEGSCPAEGHPQKRPPLWIRKEFGSILCKGDFPNTYHSRLHDSITKATPPRAKQTYVVNWNVMHRP